MKKIACAALFAATALLASAASAQSMDSSFRGFRVEGQAGYDWAHSEGNHNGKFGFGGSAGFDGVIADRIVVGPEFNYWHENHGGNTVTTGLPGGTVYHQQRDQIGGGVRVGYLVTPDFLVFGKGGYVSEGQRKLVVADDGASSFGHGHADGYQYGGGVEFTLHDKFSAVPGGLYVSAQYVRSQFDNHTSDNHAMGGIGFRFK
jgi:outer membrane immunogenic protein